MCLQILWSQETWFPDGSVLCDGKMMRVEQIEQYRLSGSSRDRARKRGGTIVRATDSWIGYVHIWCLCKKMRVGAKHIHAWQAPSIRRKVHVYISLYIYTYIYMQYIYMQIMHDIPAILCRRCLSYFHEDGLKKMKSASAEAAWHSQCCIHEHVQCYACDMSGCLLYSKSWLSYWSCTWLSTHICHAHAPNASHEVRRDDSMTASERSQVIGTCSVVAQAMLEVVRHQRRVN